MHRCTAAQTAYSAVASFSSRVLICRQFIWQLKNINNYDDKVFTRLVSKYRCKMFMSAVASFSSNMWTIYMAI